MTHKDCYGSMFPSVLIHFSMDQNVAGKVFGYERPLVGGTCLGNAEIRINEQEWDECLGCEEFEHCYK